MFVDLKNVLLKRKSFFLIECDDKSFGEECRKVCGYCYDNASCDHVTGECPGDCKDGWLGKFCNKSEYRVCNDPFW